METVHLFIFNLTKIFMKFFFVVVSQTTKNKQVKATEVYLLWIFCKISIIKPLVINTEGKLKTIFMLLKKRK